MLVTHARTLPACLAPGTQAITPWVAVYFVIVIVLGTFLLLQLFLAILLSSLDMVGGCLVSSLDMVG